jgi:hypothetical protein
MRGEREAEQRESWEIVEAHDVPDRVVQLVIFGPEYDELPALDYRGAFEAKIQEAKETFPPVAKLARGEPLTPEEEEELRAWLDSPEHYYTEETLREAYEEPGAELADFVDVALGKRRFLPKDQRIRQAFESWCRQKRLNEEQRGVLDVFTEQYIANEGWKLPEPPAPNFNVPPLADRGGLDYAKRVFGDVRNLRAIIDDLREGVLRTAA